MDATALSGVQDGWFVIISPSPDHLIVHLERPDWTKYGCELRFALGQSERGNLVKLLETVTGMSLRLVSGPRGVYTYQFGRK